MFHRRTSVSLAVLCALLAVSGVAPVHAQSEVEEAEERAEQLSEEVDEAYHIADSAVENREEVEAALLDAMNRYQQTAAELSSANAALERIRRTLVFAENSAESVESDLETQAVAAYMTAVVSTPTVVLDTQTMEDALVASHTFARGQADALSRLDQLLIRRQELERIRREYREERDRVASLTAQLEAETEELESLFAQANAEVKAAFDQALATEAEYRAALDEVDRARAAAAAERRRQEEARRATSTTTPPPSEDDAPEPPSSGDDGPSITITAATMRWKPLVDTHFAPDLAADALVIIECESGGDPEAVNPYSGAAGLFQFLPGTWAVASVKAGVGDRSVFDGEANIIAASWLAEYYRSRGLDPWRPWVCRSYL